MEVGHTRSFFVFHLLSLKKKTGQQLSCHRTNRTCTRFTIYEADLIYEADQFMRLLTISLQF